MAERRAEAQIDIAAPLARVWEVVSDFPRYREWNPFIFDVTGIDGAPAPGRRFRLHVRWRDGGEVSSLEEYVRIEPPPPSGASGPPPLRAELVYDIRGPLHALGLLRGSRTHTLTALDEHRTRYETRERFSGPLARFIPLAKVQDGFDRQTRALARRAEHAAPGLSGPAPLIATSGHELPPAATSCLNSAAAGRQHPAARRNPRPPHGAPR